MNTSRTSRQMPGSTRKRAKWVRRSCRGFAACRSAPSNAPSIPAAARPRSISCARRCGPMRTRASRSRSVLMVRVDAEADDVHVGRAPGDRNFDAGNERQPSVARRGLAPRPSPDTRRGRSAKKLRRPVAAARSTRSPGASVPSERSNASAGRRRASERRRGLEHREHRRILAACRRPLIARAKSIDQAARLPPADHGAACVRHRRRPHSSSCEAQLPSVRLRAALRPRLGRRAAARRSERRAPTAPGMRRGCQQASTSSIRYSVGLTIRCAGSPATR